MQIRTAAFGENQSYSNRMKGILAILAGVAVQLIVWMILAFRMDGPITPPFPQFVRASLATTKKARSD